MRWKTEPTLVRWRKRKPAWADCSRARAFPALRGRAFWVAAAGGHPKSDHLTNPKRLQTMGFLNRFNPFRIASTDRRRKTLLEEARSQLIDAVNSKEYYDAVVPMLRKRIYRLEQEIAKAAKGRV